jgi:long-chain fatty acid transport protein
MRHGSTQGKTQASACDAGECPRTTRRTCFGLVILLFVFHLIPGSAHGQGFGVYEQGTCTMGRGGAGVADVCDDASGIFFNPAGLTGEPGITATAGATAILVGGDFTDDRTGSSTDLQNDGIVVPHVFLRYGMNDKLAAGLGVYVPYGLGTVWPEDFEGSFLGFDNSLQSIYVQPTLAYRLSDRLSVGAGVAVIFSSVELNQRLDLSEQRVTSDAVPPGTTFGQLGIPFGTPFAAAKLEGSGTGIGGHVGVSWQALDRLKLGARFLTPVTISYEGDARFDPVATGLLLPAGNPFDAPAGTPVDAILQASGVFSTTLAEQAIETEITMPGQFVAGLSFQATPALTLLADYQWTGWSTFDEIALDFAVAPEEVQVENYGDTHGLRLGAEYALSEAFSLRAGYLTHNAAAPDETVTPLLPEGYRNEFTVGIGWQPTPAFALNVAYQYLDQNERRGRIRDAAGDAAPTPALNSGLYSFRAHLIGATLTLHL